MRIRPLLAAILVVAVMPAIEARAAPVEVVIRDNFFDPREIRVDPGDTVTWKDQGFRPHTVTSDTGLFDSGQMSSGEFSFTFEKEGTYYYHCRFHGAPHGGMWGVVIVGEPPKDRRPKISVPDDYPTIQGAVDAAMPGTAIVVEPGLYREEVVVTTPLLTIRGIDRFRTRLEGGGALTTGITVEGASGVKVKNLTVRDYTDAGIRLVGADDYTVRKVDAIMNGTFGVESVGSHGGTIARSFGWGSGEAAFRVGGCFACGILLDDLRAETNTIGIHAVNVTGVTIRGALVRNNGVGVLVHSDPTVTGPPTQGVFVVGNRVIANNNTTIPPAGVARTYGFPWGTGIWLAGTSNGVAVDNEVGAHSSYGVLLSHDFAGENVPVNNRVQHNGIRSSGSLDLAWDGSGSSDCFDDNSFATSGPADIEGAFPCSARPFEGDPYPPVMLAVEEAIAAGPTQTPADPEEPERPKCQRGKPGCRK